LKKVTKTTLVIAGVLFSSQVVNTRVVHADGPTYTPNWSLDSSGTLHIQSGMLATDASHRNHVSPWDDLKNRIVKITFDGKVKADYDISYLFSNLNKVTTIENLDNLDLSSVYYMGEVFSGDTSLLSLDLSNVKTPNALSMEYMFSGDTSLTSLNLSDFNTSQVRQMTGMFSGDTSLTSLDLSSFNTTAILALTGIDKQMAVYQMFDGVKNLSSIKLSPNISFAPFKEDYYMLNLTDPTSNVTYTGKWVNSKGQKLDSLKDYNGVGGDGSDVWSGTWNWEKR
jgi:surface protein